VPPGSNYIIRVEAEGVAAPLPELYHDLAPIAVSGSDVRRNVTMQGRKLRGRATIAGVPTEGVVLLAGVDAITDLGWMKFGVSAADGTWTAGVFTSDGNWVSSTRALYLQPNVQYFFACESLLGTSYISGYPPLGYWTFPTETPGMECRTDNASASRWTHNATRTVMTAWPGVFVDEYFDAGSGWGWGVQHVATPGSPPGRQFGGIFNSFKANQLAPGEFLYAVDGTVYDRLSFVSATTAPAVSILAGGARRVIWNLDPSSYAGSPLRVRQTSYDGSGGDYVLMQLRLENATAARVTAYVGGSFDWNVQTATIPFTTNQAGTELGGKLAYVYASGGNYFGTVYFGTYSQRGLLIDVSGDRPANILQVLQGHNSTPNMGPADVRVIQSVGPLRLNPGQRKTVWLAIVSASTLSGLITSANAAAADYSARTGLSPF
jgi:hypothetical protein